MTDSQIFDTEPEGTRERLLRAAFSVLQQDGYEGLSMEVIAKEAGIQKASIYHHYSTKDELLFSFLEFVMDHVEQKMAISTDKTPVEELQAAVDRAVLPNAEQELYSANAGPSDAMVSAYIQVRAQATYRPEYQKQVTKLDKAIKRRLANLIEEASEQGLMRDVEPDWIAEAVMTTVTGALHRRVTSDSVNHMMIREEVQRYLDQFIRPEYQHCSNTEES